MRLTKYFFVISILVSSLNLQAEIILHKKDATVWGQNQNIKGELVSFFSDNGTLYLNNLQIQFQISSSDSSFEVPITIGEGLNTVFVEIDSSGTTIASETLKLTLGYKLRPEIFAYPTVSGNAIRLHSQVIENPDSATLFYFWEADEMNPSITIIETPHDSTANIVLVSNAPFGEYYFNLKVVASDGDTTTARTFVTLDSTGIHPFQIKTDHASWIDRAVIYEITPCDFVDRSKYSRDFWPENTRISSSEDLLPMNLDQGFSIVDELKEIARERNVSIAQVALNYILRKPGVTSVVIGARTKKQLMENIRSSTWELTNEEIDRLDKLSEPVKIYPHWYFEIFRKGQLNKLGV